jgi:hypothetical protein
LGVAELGAGGVDPRSERFPERLGLACYLPFPEWFDWFIGSATVHVNGDGAGGDGDGHCPGDPGERGGGVDGEPFDFHVLGVADAASDGGRPLISGVEQPPQVLMVSAIARIEDYIDLIE